MRTAGWRSRRMHHRRHVHRSGAGAASGTAAPRAAHRSGLVGGGVWRGRLGRRPAPQRQHGHVAQHAAPRRGRPGLAVRDDLRRRQRGDDGLRSEGAAVTVAATAVMSCPAPTDSLPRAPSPTRLPGACRRPWTPTAPTSAATACWPALRCRPRCAPTPGRGALLACQRSCPALLSES